MPVQTNISLVKSSKKCIGKLQITNPKQITISNVQNKKNEPNDLDIGFDIVIL